ncbi:MAG: copper resistance protein B [Rhodospirillales bacterium]|nr:copper resistance protein B [Rhodospirillales bacterium]
MTEGRYSNGELDDGIHQFFYGRAVTTYFDAMIGTRWDIDSQPTRGWGAIGFQGLAPQWFKVSAFGYVSGDGHLAARLEASYDILITQRLILQPQIELNFYTKDDPFYTKDDPARLIGAGLSELDAGLRLRYEVTRQFAPYIGITYLGQFGSTADYVSAAGARPSSWVSLLACGHGSRPSGSRLRLAWRLQGIRCLGHSAPAIKCTSRSPRRGRGPTLPVTQAIFPVRRSADR